MVSDDGAHERISRMKTAGLASGYGDVGMTVKALAAGGEAMGHASISTTLRHYAHMFDAAQLANGAPMIATIEAARADLEARGVHPTYAGAAVRVLYAPATRANTA